jgi:hypothetical protein
MSYSDLDFYSNVIERFNALPEIIEQRGHGMAPNEASGEVR